MPAIVVKMDGADEIRKRLSTLAARMGDISPIMKIIGERILLRTEERFKGQGPAPDGTPWAPLAPSTRRLKKHHKILTESGGLKGSIAYRVMGNVLIVGTNKVYAAIHQFGGRTAARTIRPRQGKALYWPGAAHPVRVVKHPGSAIPARPFLGISERESIELIGIIERYLEER